MKDGAKGPSIAFVLGGKPDKGEPPDDESEEASDEEYRSYAETAFPDEEWTPERLKALKQFVMACMG